MSQAPTAPAQLSPGDTNAVANAATGAYDGAQGLIAYADPWTTPPEAFFDLYDLLPRLNDPQAHLQMEGRRGTGKTVLMVNAYLRMRQLFEQSKGSPPYTVAIYIDLSQDVGTPKNNFPMVRGLLLYQQILRLILTASLRPGHRRDRRFWGLQDYLDERPHWFRRLYSRWRLDRYRSYVDALPEAINADDGYQKLMKALRGEIVVTSFSSATMRVARMAFPSSRAAQGGGLQPGARPRPASHPLPAIVLEKKLGSIYNVFGARVQEYLESLLDALQVQNLILFLDEWSGPSVGSETQPYLYEQLARTFPPGGRVVLKLATIPGATRLTFDSSKFEVPTVHLDQLASFQPHFMRRRLTRMLILNLKATLGTRFPAPAYLAESQDADEYPLFTHDVFRDKEAADELARAGESLPRQLLILFMASAQLRGQYTPGRKVTAGLVRMAAREHFATRLYVTIRQDAQVSAVFDEIVKAGRRVVDVERVPELFDALDWLVNEGVMFRCEVNLPDGRLRYKLSYPAEVYRLAAQAEGGGSPTLDAYEKMQIEEVTYCENYVDPPRVALAHLLAPPPETEPEMAQSAAAPAIPPPAAPSAMETAASTAPPLRE
jgi:hypothetical protein